MALLANMCSAPINSVVSLNIEVPPISIILSLNSPTNGFAASPEVGSEPPHSVPIINSLTGKISFCNKVAS